MADEQHEWLDADAAEMLLRGESVESVDDHARTGARRLEAALLALRSSGPTDGELPGEAAALAAFRELSGGRERAAGAAGPAALAGREAPHTVRIGAAQAAPRRRPRWTRPARYGLAVSLAGCALGGVAVAGGTGMLPTPFGGHGSPVPATSVSAAATPGELAGEVPGAGEQSSPPAPGTPGVPSAPAPSDVPEAPDGGTDGGTAGSDGRSGQDSGDAPDREGAGPDSGSTGGTRDGTDGREAPGRSPAEAYRKSVKACLDHREDALSREGERRLLDLAGGERNLDRFCDRLLGEGGRNGGSGSGENGEDDGGNGKGSLPSFTFRTQPAESAQGGAPQGGTTPRPPAGPTVDSRSALSSAPR